MSAEGRVAIAYAAWLRIGPLRWKYAGLLVRDAGHGASTTSNFGEAREPEGVEDGLRWECGELGAKGTWRNLLVRHAREARPALRLHEGVLWNPVMPRAEVEIDAAGERWHGLGYVECLEMRTPPWRLPVDELRWGRWIGERSSLVWIEWKGASTRRWVRRDGEPAACVEIDDSCVRGDGWCLSLVRETTLRDAELGTTALAAAPCLQRLVPARMRHTREAKWLSRGVLTSAGGAGEEGWSVHEVVRFGGGSA